MSLTEIISGCKKQQRAAQSALFELKVDEVMNLCVRYLKNSHDAKDLVQEIFIRVFEKIKTYDPQKGTLGAWMIRIAINECLQFLRKRKRISLLGVVDDNDKIDGEELVLSNLTAKEIFAEVANLPDGYRIIFNLYVVEGFAHKEIAELLQISPSSSRSQLARAKATLRNTITKNSNLNFYEKAE